MKRHSESEDDSVKYKHIKNQTFNESFQDSLTDYNDHETNIKLLIYWFDSYEDKTRPTIYLFGKTYEEHLKLVDEPINNGILGYKGYSSVCLVIKNLPRILYVKPNTSASIHNVKKEIISIFLKHKIKRYSFAVEKKSCLFHKSKSKPNTCDEASNKACDEACDKARDNDQTLEAEYLRVEYSSLNYNETIIKSGNTFTCVLNSKLTYLEQLILDLKLKGPSWLYVKSLVRNSIPITWCKYEYIVNDYRNISLYQEIIEQDSLEHKLTNTTIYKNLPPLTLITLSINTRFQKGEHEILCVSGLILKNFYLNGKLKEEESSFCAIQTKMLEIRDPGSIGCQVLNLKNEDKYLGENLKKELKLLKESSDGRMEELNVTTPAINNDQAINNNQATVINNKHNSNDDEHELQNSKFNSFSSNNIVTCISERALLSYLLSLIQVLDVDIILGFDLFNYILDIISNRCAFNLIPNWSRLGRLRKLVFKRNYASSSLKYSNKYGIQLLCTGRLICDISMTFKHLNFISTNSNDDLLSDKFLDFNSEIELVLENDKLEKRNGNTETRINLIQAFKEYSACVLITCERFQFIQLAYEMTCVVGNVLSRTLTSGCLERNEYFFLHSFHQDGFILPTKNYDIQDNTSLKTSYKGGLVLDPIVGLYDKIVLLMDFNSLYSSIILEANICFSTISNYDCFNVSDQDFSDALFNVIKHGNCNNELGTLPKQIKKIIDSRQEIKKLMMNLNQNEELYKQYDIRQMALKLIANSIYGCLGCKSSRFYCKRLAAMIASYGRNILKNTKLLAEKNNLQVIYGDTDSILIDTKLSDYEQVITMGNKFKSEINSNYKFLEIGLDEVYKVFYLLGKKRYAGLRIHHSTNNAIHTVIKGLEMIKRDQCLMVKNIGNHILNEILKVRTLNNTGQNRDSVVQNIKNIVSKVSNNFESYDFNQFIISKQLILSPECYSNRNVNPINQSHALVAMRCNSNLNNVKKYKAGDIVQYLVCDDGNNNNIIRRSYSITEFKDKRLKIDYMYYLRQHLFPMITRLCAPLVNIDISFLENLFIIKPKNQSEIHKTTTTKHQNNSTKISKFLYNNFENCIPFTYICPDCKHVSIWTNPIIKDSNEPLIDNYKDLFLFKLPRRLSILDACSECGFEPINKLIYIKDKIMIDMNKFMEKYNKTWVRCEGYLCSYRKKNSSSISQNGKQLCVKCGNFTGKLEYSQSDLHNQMKYYKFIFDPKDTDLCDSKVLDALNELKDFVDNQFLKQNSYNFINLKVLFASTLKN